MSARTERIRKLLNELNIGTHKERVGDAIAELLEESEDLAAKVSDLEDRVTALEEAS